MNKSSLCSNFFVICKCRKVIHFGSVFLENFCMKVSNGKYYDTTWIGDMLIHYMITSFHQVYIYTLTLWKCLHLPCQYACKEDFLKHISQSFLGRLIEIHFQNLQISTIVTTSVYLYFSNNFFIFPINFFGNYYFFLM